MNTANSSKQPFTVLKSAVNILLTHPAIIFPFVCLVFIQILLLEIIFFAPRYPLSLFFEPMIMRLETPAYMHYPYNYELLIKWFQKIQMPVQIVFGSFFTGSVVLIIDAINRDSAIKFRSIFRKTLRSYLHLFLLFVLMVSLISGLTFLYSKFVVDRALLIRSTAGMFFILKQAILLTAPVVNLILAILLNVLFAYVVPFIVLEQKKIFSALGAGIAYTFRNFWQTALLVFLPALLYIVIIALRMQSSNLMQILEPEVWWFFLLISIAINMIVDAVQYTAVTTYYLVSKELKPETADAI